MAVLDISFESESLARTVDVKAVVPNDLRRENKAGNPAYDRAMKTLILLHGFGGHRLFPPVGAQGFTQRGKAEPWKRRRNGEAKK